MPDRRATILGLASALALVIGGFLLAWAGPLQEIRIPVKGMVCPA